MTMTFEEFKDSQNHQLKIGASRFWAKRSDEHAHMRIPNTYSVYCGRYNVMLGNNYAPALTSNGVCHECLKKAYNLHLQIK